MTSARRPSLPHIYDDLPVHFPSSSCRPRSAGQDAGPEPLRVPSVPRKLGSKYSLLNLFRKAADTTASSSTPESSQIPSSAASTPPASPSLCQVPSPYQFPLDRGYSICRLPLLPSHPLWRINIVHGLAIRAWEARALQELSCRIHGWSIREPGSRPESQEGAAVDGSGTHTTPPRPSILCGHHHSRSSSSNHFPATLPYQPKCGMELFAF
jgi:hypothetical protein